MRPAGFPVVICISDVVSTESPGAADGASVKKYAHKSLTGYSTTITLQYAAPFAGVEEPACHAIHQNQTA